MSIIYYGLKTQSGSWYLVEDHTHLMGKPTFYIYLSGEKHRVQALVGTALGDIRKDDAKITQALQSGNALFKDSIKNVQQFIGKAVFASNFSINALTSYSFGQMVNTSLVVEVILFK